MELVKLAQNDSRFYGTQLRERAVQAVDGELFQRQIRRGLAILAQLNLVMRKQYKDQPARLAAWRFASRAEKLISGRPRKAAPAAPKPIAAPIPKPAFALP